MRDPGIVLVFVGAYFCISSLAIGAKEFLWDQVGDTSVSICIGIMNDTLQKCWECYRKC
jgi:hypothetical protein